MSVYTERKILVPAYPPKTRAISDVIYPRALPTDTPFRTPNIVAERAGDVRVATERRFRILGRFAGKIPKESQSHQQMMDSSDTKEQSYMLSLAANGVYFDQHGELQLSETLTKEQKSKYLNLEKSLFGPNGNTNFGCSEISDVEDLGAVLNESAVRNLFHEQFLIDPISMVRMAYLIGGVNNVMYYDKFSFGKRMDASRFIGHTSSLGQSIRSREAIAAGMSKYVLSGGNLERDQLLYENILRVGAAIDQDPVIIKTSSDLGLSQFFRLRNVLAPSSHKNAELSRLYTEYKQMADQYPNSSMTFYLSTNVPELKESYLLANLALLNCLQYQPNSPIELAGIKRGITTLKTNPSIEPVTNALYNMLKLVQPSIAVSYSTVSLCRPEVASDFDAVNDARLITSTVALSRAVYAGRYHLPEAHYLNFAGEEEPVINLGDAYFDQSVLVNNGRFLHKGTDSSPSGLSVFAGFGDNVKALNYFLIYLNANPHLSKVLPGLAGIRSLADVDNFIPSDRRRIFDSIRQYILANHRIFEIETKAKSLYKELMS